MRQQVYIIYNNKTKEISDKICSRVFVNKQFLSDDLELTTDILLNMASNSMCEYFYVIRSDADILFDDFDFSFKPEKWDNTYVHTWNNDKTVRLYNTEKVLATPEKYTDSELEKGNICLKNIIGKIFRRPLYDIVFIGYDEEYADRNFSKLKERFSRAMQVHNIKGILNAHKAAAKLANSEMFYVVDADAEIVPAFDFSYQPSALERETVHVWHSHNPVNDLEYGYGGIKLFPTKLLMEYNGSPIDFTTSVSKEFKVLPEVSNITNFNTDPYSAWRSGFRECVKLASKLIPNQVNDETEHRLNIWCTKGASQNFGEFVIMGANEGREYGTAHKDQPELLGLINDFKWLELKFSA